MSERNRHSPYDASAPQADGLISFSWSGFCKPDIMRGYASVLAHICEKQRARENQTQRSGNTSRRILWRNSLLCQRSWCPSFRPPAHAKLPSRPSNRSAHRSMSNRHRPKANTTNLLTGQGLRSAPTLTLLNMLAPRSAHWGFLACPVNFLWPESAASASLWTRRRLHCGASARFWRASPVRALTEPVNRSFSCPKSLSCWQSAQLSQFRPVHAKHRNQSPSWPSRSWSSPPPARANTAKTFTGPVFRPDAITAAAAPRSEGRPC